MKKKTIQPMWYQALIPMITLFGLAIPANAAITEEHGDTNTKSLKWIAGFNSSNGNSNFSDLTIANGSTSNIEPGGGLHLYGGMLYRSHTWLETSLTFGIHYDYASSNNGSNHFSRYPVEIVPTYIQGNNRLGVGISYHINPELAGDDVLNQSVSFDNALGTLTEYGYKITPFLYLGLRLMVIEYKVNNPAANNNVEKVSGDQLSINLNYIF